MHKKTQTCGSEQGRFSSSKRDCDELWLVCFYVHFNDLIGSFTAAFLADPPMPDGRLTTITRALFGGQLQLYKQQASFTWVFTQVSTLFQMQPLTLLLLHAAGLLATAANLSDLLSELV
jgi:hypothetical protein